MAEIDTEIRDAQYPQRRSIHEDAEQVKSGREADIRKVDPLHVGLAQDEREEFSARRRQPDTDSLCTEGKTLQVMQSAHYGDDCRAVTHPRRRRGGAPHALRDNEDPNVKGKVWVLDAELEENVASRGGPSANFIAGTFGWPKMNRVEHVNAGAVGSPRWHRRCFPRYRLVGLAWRRGTKFCGSIISESTSLHKPNGACIFKDYC
ncbi:hypothetical protein B0H11DRAFT_1275889 [Mycena galericulata]|nr:hypothetical protein B0H11DRAFT_1275889 [Mycena galericulata]